MTKDVRNMIKGFETNILYKNGKINSKEYYEAIRKSVTPKDYTEYLLWKCDVFVDVLAIVLSVEDAYNHTVTRKQIVSWLENFKEEHHDFV